MFKLTALILCGATIFSTAHGNCANSCGPTILDDSCGSGAWAGGCGASAAPGCAGDISGNVPCGSHWGGYGLGGGSALRGGSALVGGLNGLQNGFFANDGSGNGVRALRPFVIPARSGRGRLIVHNTKPILIKPQSTQFYLPPSPVIVKPYVLSQGSSLSVSPTITETCGPSSSIRPVVATVVHRSIQPAFISSPCAAPAWAGFNGLGGGNTGLGASSDGSFFGPSGSSAFDSFGGGPSDLASEATSECASCGGPAYASHGHVGHAGFGASAVPLYDAGYGPAFGCSPYSACDGDSACGDGTCESGPSCASDTCDNTCSSC